MSQRSDPELLAAHVAGEDGAFAELFARHRDRLWAVALRTTGHPEEAADALQDAMLSAYRRAGSFRGDAAVTTWLHRIVVNACYDRIRRARVRAAEPLPDDLDRRSVDPAPGPESLVENQDLRRRLLAGLADLPTDQRAAIVLVDVQGYSVEETARILDCATGTVKSRCSRGRAKLATMLADLRADSGVAPPAADGTAAGRRTSQGGGQGGGGQ